MTFEPIIDYMVLGVVGALALFAWLVLRQMKKEGRGSCGGSCAGCAQRCVARKEDKKK
ncbi:MAG: FeoB-associated Cys-rich membrane protein [Butyricicoccus sp.]|nr:FeoB-associated Cys-rich membrane protein [Butyricicoccus sp.]